jgi:integrase
MFMRGLSKRAELKDFGFHAIRHMVASVLNDTHKVFKREIQKTLRNRSQRTTEIYLHSLEEDLRDTMKLLEGRNMVPETQDLKSPTSKRKGSQPP